MIRLELHVRDITAEAITHAGPVFARVTLGEGLCWYPFGYGEEAARNLENAAAVLVEGARKVRNAVIEQQQGKEQAS